MYIKVYYSLLDWEWYAEPNTFRVFLHLLLTANRKDKPYRGDVIKRGEVLASAEYIANKTGLSIQSVKTALKNLLKTREITKRKIGKTNVYSIVSYSRWQGANHEITHKLTANQPSVNRDLTTLRDCNNEENVIMKECERNTHARGKLKNVYISDKEYEQLRKEYSFADEIIDELSAKIATGDPKYKSGHIGHLYVFARNFSKRKTSENTSYDIELAMKRALALDPAKTKRE